MKSDTYLTQSTHPVGECAIHSRARRWGRLKKAKKLTVDPAMPRFLSFSRQPQRRTLKRIQLRNLG